MLFVNKLATFIQSGTVGLDPKGIMAKENRVDVNS